MKIAVIGCSHGSLDDIYASVSKADAEGQARGEPPVELVLCCGDFQVRGPTTALSHSAVRYPIEC